MPIPSSIISHPQVCASSPSMVLLVVPTWHISALPTNSSRARPSRYSTTATVNATSPMSMTSWRALCASCRKPQNARTVTTDSQSLHTRYITSAITSQKTSSILYRYCKKNSFAQKSSLQTTTLSHIKNSYQCKQAMCLSLMRTPLLSKTTSDSSQVHLSVKDLESSPSGIRNSICRILEGGNGIK